MKFSDLFKINIHLQKQGMPNAQSQVIYVNHTKNPKYVAISKSNSNSKADRCYMSLINSTIDKYINLEHCGEFLH